MGKVVGWMQKMGRVKTGGRMGMEKLRVRLFRNLSKFRTIYDIASPLVQPITPL